MPSGRGGSSRAPEQITHIKRHKPQIQALRNHTPFEELLMMPDIKVSDSIFKRRVSFARDIYSYEHVLTAAFPDAEGECKLSSCDLA